jgi:hypothetical protein
MPARRMLLAAIAVCLGSCAPAAAAGGHYAFDGGTAAERAQVSAALSASAFDWSIVPAQITVHIARGATSSAGPGEIWLDADLLDAGTFSWGVVQHEYAHEVDFLLLDDTERASLLRVLGGRTWCYGDSQALPHAAYGCERFASTLAWAFWPSPENCMRPARSQGETSAFPTATFRMLVRRLLSGVTRK